MTNPNMRDREVYNREIRREHQVIRERDDASAANGMLLGIIFTALIGIIGAAFYFANQKPTTQQAPARTTIIERTKETVTPPKAPDVNITVPNPPPVEVPDVNVNVSPSPAPSAPAAPANQQAPAEAPATESAPAEPGQ